MAERLTIRCAAESAARGEPLAGTAVARVRRWLIVEQPGPWGRDALLESRLDREVALALGAAAQRSGVRVVLARRPGWRSAGPARRVFLAHSGPESRWLEWVDLDVADEPALLALDLDVLRRPVPPGIGSPGPPTLFLVCTHGRHDPCCADHGRPIVRHLAAQAGGGGTGSPGDPAAGLDDVWECSHIGGDRFAGNIVCLPDGIYFGRVDARTSSQVVSDYRRGLIDLDHYRGRSSQPPAVQAAEAAARADLGERRIDSVTVLAAEERRDHTVVVRVGQREGAVLEVTVARERADRVQLTCHASEPAAPWRYVVRGVRRV